MDGKRLSATSGEDLHSKLAESQMHTATRNALNNLAITLMVMCTVCKQDKKLNEKMQVWLYKSLAH